MVNIRLRGLRSPNIPSGTIVGRTGNGNGEAQLLSIQNLRGMGVATHADVSVQIAAANPAVADGDVMANISGASAQASGTTVSALLDHVFSGATGSILYRAAGGWTALAAGSSGKVLTMGASVPAWAAPASGGVTSISAGTGISLSTNPLVSTGTISLASGAAVANLGYTPAHAGTNGDITNITGLTTPLNVAQGGTGQTNIAQAGLGIQGLQMNTLNSNTTLTQAQSGGLLLLNSSSPFTVTFPTGVFSTYTLANTGTATVTLTYGGGGNGPATLPPGYAVTLFCDPNLGNQYWIVSYSSLTAPISGTVPVASGGTGATTAGGARTNLSAAASGANSDITSLTGLTTALPITEGGTGATTPTAALTNLGAAGLGTSNTFTGSVNSFTNQLLINQSGVTDTWDGGAIIGITGPGGANTSINFTTYYGSATQSSSRLIFQNAGGTASSPTNNIINDVLGAFVFAGYNAGFKNTSAFRAVASENWSSGHQGTAFQIFLTPNGSTSAQTALTVLGDGTLTTGPSQSVLRTPGLSVVKIVSTVSGLPSAATEGNGACRIVTDALTPVLGSTVVGGGAVRVPVNSDGTNWRVG